MKLSKNFGALLGLLGSLMVAFGSIQSAQAQVANTLETKDVLGWCHITGKLRFMSVGLIVGGTEGHGRGHIVCEYYDGTYEDVPVAIDTASIGLSLGIASGTSNLFASGIGIVSRGARTLLGEYATVKGSVQVLTLGGDAGLSLTIGRHGMSIPVTLQGRSGKGFQAGAEFGNFTFTEMVPVETAINHQAPPVVRKAVKKVRVQEPVAPAGDVMNESELPPPPPM